MPRYRAENGRIIGENLEYFSNRTIFAGHSNFYIMAGDRALIRLGCHRYLLGTLRLEAGGKPLEDSEYVKMSYAGGRVDWLLRDGAFGEITLTVTTAGDARGMALRAVSPLPIRFVYGGLTRKDTDPDQSGSASAAWNLCVAGVDASLTREKFRAEWLKNNRVCEEEGYIENPDVSGALEYDARMFLRCDAETRTDGREIAGCFHEYLTIGMGSGFPELENCFREGLARSERLFRELDIETPNEYLNAATRAAAAEMDGAWHPPKTMHGNFSWNQPFVGWLMHAHHVTGHAERSKATLCAYARAQVKENTKCSSERSEDGCMPGSDSRFYGSGYIAEDQIFYNMQTQFFHQMISAWRYSGDTEMADVLREALRLHLEREDACFDPDGTGLYESTINTWPTDSVFTSGGGALEETCYVYCAAKAMSELTEGAQREAYAAKAEKIRRAFFDKLWIPSLGYPGAYVEWGGHKRLHKDAWLYSAFLPVECGMLDEFQTEQALYYPRWALERDPNGLFWISNWTPGIWSVRECSWGENVQLAIADCLSGNTRDALKMLDGVAKRCMSGVIPCDLSYPVLEGATQLARAVVEGLFGYHPDYPNGTVEIAPQMPFEWDKASMGTSDFKICCRRNALRVELARPARMKLRLRLYARKLIGVEGAQSWRLVPSIGGYIVEVTTDTVREADVRLIVEDERDFEGYTETDRLPEGELYNPQGVTADSHGHHMVFQKTPEGWWREIRLDMGKDPQRAEQIRRQRTVPAAGALFETLELDKYMNADVARIFRQSYLTPRAPGAGSAQIGYDGFSAWTFRFWGVKPPQLTLNRIGVWKSKGGIPVRICGGERNIAFTSLWDNYPAKLSFPVERTGRAAYITVAGSTNPMQCGIENARLTFLYEDGETEVLPLVNPQNYIQLCAYPPRAATEGHEDRADVFNRTDEGLLKDFTPEVLDLGENLRALLIAWALRPVRLASIKLETLSPDVVCGLMGVTLEK